MGKKNRSKNEEGIGHDGKMEPTYRNMDVEERLDEVLV